MAPGRPGCAAGPRRRTVLFGAAIAAVILLALGVGLVAFRYLPALNEARVLRADLETMVERALGAGLEIDRATLDELDAQHQLGEGATWPT